jgi:hypothetical protein
MNLKKNFNEKLTNLIDHKYIDKSFLFSIRFMKRFFYIIMMVKFGLSNNVIIQVDEITIYFITRSHAQSYFSLFIHIIYTIL